MLSDEGIRAAILHGDLEVEPLNHSAIQPASLDLHLGNTFLRMSASHVLFIDPKRDQTSRIYELVTPCADGTISIHPHQLVLATTREQLRLSNSLAGRLEGKSSVGRMGLMVHSTAGFFDPGFQGEATLELVNVSPLPIKLYPGMPICQFSLHKLDSPATRGYSGKYMGQVGPQPSRYFKNWPW